MAETVDVARDAMFPKLSAAQIARLVPRVEASLQAK